MIHDLDYIYCEETAGKSIEDVSLWQFFSWFMVGETREMINWLRVKYVFWGVLILCLSGCATPSAVQVEFIACQEEGKVWSMVYNEQTGAYDCRCEMVKFKW